MELRSQMATTIKQVESALTPTESFVPRHIGPGAGDIEKMVEAIGFRTLDELIDSLGPVVAQKMIRAAIDARAL